MLLAIDTGNTNTLFAIHDMEGSWVFEWRIATNSTRTADEYAVWFHQLLDMANLKFSDITACVLSSCLLYTSPSPRDQRGSRMPSSA